VKGRMYALRAETGEIVWETYLVPRGPEDVPRGPAGSMPDFAANTWGNGTEVPITGGGTWTSYSLDPASGHVFIPTANPAPDFVASLREGSNLFTNSVVELDARNGAYVKHFQRAPKDWHDWDVSNTPALITTRANQRLMAFAPKDGHLYGVDLGKYQLVYRSAVTRIENDTVPLTTRAPTRFCPGALGGAEWNGVAFDPQYNLLLSGETDWCTTVRLQSDTEVKAIPQGQSWLGHAKTNPLDLFGSQDPHTQWGGWLYATDADTGTWKWRIRTNYPIVGGVTPTAGGVVFFGDTGGHFYAVDVRSGKRLWSQKLQGAVGGGVITYLAGGRQRVAVASGLTSILWPTEQATGRIVVMGLP
jgi:alcohol dehydrogenase (cytochrome c)